MKLTRLAAAVIMLGIGSAPVAFADINDGASGGNGVANTTGASNAPPTAATNISANSNPAAANSTATHYRGKRAKTVANEENAANNNTPATAPVIPGQPVTDYSDIMLGNVVNRNQDSVGGPLSDWYKHLGISGFVLANAKSDTNLGQNTQSNLYSRGTELFFDAQMNDWVAGHITLAYGQDNFNANNYANTTFSTTDNIYYAGTGNSNGVQPWSIYLEEATISLANFNKSPLWLTAGRQEFLFGSYMRNTISGSLPRFLTDTDDTGVSAGYVSPIGAHAELFAAQGPQSSGGTVGAVTAWGANVGITEAPSNALTYNFNVGFINNLYENYWIQNNAAQFFNGNGNTNPAYHKLVPGIAAHFDAMSGPFQFIADYATATTHFSPLDLPEGTPNQPTAGPVAPFTNQGAQPWAYLLETSYRFPVVNYDTKLILGYQQSGDAVNIENPNDLGGYQMPQYRYVVSYAINITKDLTAQIEYDHDIGYKVANGGTGQSDNIALAQLGLVF